MEPATWSILDDEGIDKRDSDLAIQVARKGNELTNGKEYAYLDTLARVHWELGNVEKAVEFQAKSVKFSGEMIEAEFADPPPDVTKEEIKEAKEEIGQLITELKETLPKYKDEVSEKKRRE